MYVYHIAKQVTSSFTSKYQFPFVTTVDLKYDKIIHVPVLCTVVCSIVETTQFVDVFERCAVEKISTYEGGNDVKLTEVQRGRILIF